jgi:hypothetical protein
MISDKYKCIHIHIPKSAGTSINHSLCGWITNDFDKEKKLWKQHATALETKKYYTNDKQWNNYFKFAIVRNPFDRMVSSYNFLCRRMMKPCDFRDKLLFKKFIFKKGIFKKLLNPSLIIEKENRYHQIRTATDFVMDKNDNILVDYIGRFENIEDDWNFICEQLGTKIKLEHRNKNNRRYKHYRDYYDDDTKKCVAEACKKDLEIFKYKF